MPITPDPATRHDALHRKPDPSGVSVRVTGHTTRPSVALTLARAASGVPAYVTADQVAAMVACATTTRDRLLLRTLWESGGRVSEVASLRLCDIDRAEGALQLTNLKQRGPRRHVKLVSISRDLAGALLAFARDTTGTSSARVNPGRGTSPASRSCALSTGLPSTPASSCEDAPVRLPRAALTSGMVPPCTCSGRVSRSPKSSPISGTAGWTPPPST